MRVAGTEVCWRRFGTGPVLVLLHGGHGSWLHWVRNIEVLAGRFTVWVPDMPGYGDSGAVPPPGDLAAVLRAMVASLDALIGSATPIRLAGFAFGGLVSRFRFETGSERLVIEPKFPVLWVATPTAERISSTKSSTEAVRLFGSFSSV